MTELSYYHNGATSGDADQAPYNAALYAKVVNASLSTEGGYVFPLYLNELAADYPGAGSCRVVSGAAMVGGVLFVSDATVNLPMADNTASFPRMDRVVVRVDWAAHTARLAIKTGRPSPLPAPPELTQVIGEVYEMSLARIWVAAGFDSATSGFEVLDERVFANTALHENTYAVENMMPDSEFLSFYDSGARAAGIAAGSLHAMWDYTGTITSGSTPYSSELPPQMSRGHTWYVGLPTDGVDYIHFSWQLANNPASPIPITYKILVEATDFIRIGDFGLTWAVDVPPTRGMEEIVVHTTIAAGAVNPILYVSGNSPNASFRLGQITLTYGKIAAPFGTHHETVLYGERARNFYSLARSSGTYATSFNEGSSALGLPKGILALISLLEARDTGSGGLNTCNISVQSNQGAADQLRIELGRTTNSAYRYAHGIIGLDPDTFTDPDNIDGCDVVVVASGANAMLYYCYTTGIII